MASIYPNKKDGKIVSFKFKAFLGRDGNGKQIIKCKTWFPDKPMRENRLNQLAEKEATLWERELLAQPSIIEPAHSYVAVSKSSMLLSDFVNNIWFPAQISEKELRPTTIAFKSHLLKVILPYFDSKYLGSITSKDINEYLIYLRADHKTKDGRSPSQQTIKHLYCTLNLIFDYAVKLEDIAVNPLSNIPSPKLTKHKVDALTDGEVSLFIKEIYNLPHKQRAMYMLLLTTGMRRGECFGLQWGDIDFDASVIHIQRNVTYSTLGVNIGYTKTAAGERTVPMTNRLHEILLEYKQSENALSPLDDDMFLFHAEATRYTPQDPTYITKHMRRLMKRIGLPDMSPHDLRHTCASLLIQSGADIKSVQDILGHADASTTLNFYARSDMNGMKKAVEGVFGR